MYLRVVEKEVLWLKSGGCDEFIGGGSLKYYGGRVANGKMREFTYKESDIAGSYVQRV